MKYAIFLILALFSTSLQTSAATPDHHLTLNELLNQGYAVTCFLSGEQESGGSKLCYYDCTCGTKVLNVRATEICPPTERFEC